MKNFYLLAIYLIAVTTLYSRTLSLPEEGNASGIANMFQHYSDEHDKAIATSWNEFGRYFIGKTIPSEVMDEFKRYGFVTCPHPSPKLQNGIIVAAELQPNVAYFDYHGPGTPKGKPTSIRYIIFRLPSGKYRLTHVDEKEWSEIQKETGSYFKQSAPLLTPSPQ